MVYRDELRPNKIPPELQLKCLKIHLSIVKLEVSKILCRKSLILVS
jgi:hypothetical protein